MFDSECFSSEVCCP
uniref:Uncharacterized protein n=1 Tax=Lepeophtheirus salmonis TaxID=72036 RepID=A0A0K2TSP1_LEPSM